MESYLQIINPTTGRKVFLKGKAGQKIYKKYLKNFSENVSFTQNQSGGLKAVGGLLKAVSWLGKIGTGLSNQQLKMEQKDDKRDNIQKLLKIQKQHYINKTVDKKKPSFINLLNKITKKPQQKLEQKQQQDIIAKPINITKDINGELSQSLQKKLDSLKII